MIRRRKRIMEDEEENELICKEIKPPKTAYHLFLERENKILTHKRDIVKVELIETIIKAASKQIRIPFGVEEITIIGFNKRDYIRIKSNKSATYIQFHSVFTNHINAKILFSFNVQNMFDMDVEVIRNLSKMFSRGFKVDSKNGEKFYVNT